MLVQFSHRFRNLFSNWRRQFVAVPVKRAPVLITSVGVTALVLGLRQFGALEPMELWAYDLLLRSRLKEKPDPRLLVVTVTEEDIQRVRRWPLPDSTLATLLEKLQRHNPRAIGLDIYRDFPVDPGHNKLIAQLSQSDRVITICKASAGADDPGVAPPPTVPLKHVGFSDLVIDPDGVIRRALLVVTPDRGNCQTPFSFSFQLASRYLAREGIVPDNSQPAGDLQIGSVVFPPLKADAGGYQGVDARGYQILLNYRSADAVAQKVTLTQVLTDRFKPEWVKDRIVLIGVTAPSTKDAFYTPYSPAQRQQPKMPGVVVHAQVVSQILSAVLDKRNLLWYMPWWGEALWTWSFALLGGLSAMRLGHPLRLGLLEGAALGGLVAVCYGLISFGGWVPPIPPAIALVATGGATIVYIAYQIHQQQENVGRLSEDQEQTIALLTSIMKQSATSKEEETVRQRSTDRPEAESPSHSSAYQLSSSSLLDGRYRITRPLSQGGFGHTYLAQDTKRPGEPTCVVKHLKPARRDRKFLLVARRLFETEAKILEVLGRHEQIPQLLAYFEQNEEFYLIEEYIEGHPLSDEIPVDKRISEARAVDLLKGVLEVLAFIHEHHVIHRDIKPSNIIRRQKDDRLVLIDFGAVKQMEAPLDEDTESDETVAIGTRGYAPPEQLVGHPRPSSDIYALGTIAIQGLTGISPQQLQQELDDGGTIVWRRLAHASDELAQILDKMVQYHFSDRYQSAAAVLEDLNQLDPSMLSTQASASSQVSPSSESYSESLSESWGSTIHVDQESKTR